jgi:hypothetical protein
MREVAKRGGIDSRLAVDGIAVTAAWFAVLAPVGSSRGRRAGGASAVTPRLARVVVRHRWRAALFGGSCHLAKLTGGLLLRAGVIDWGGCHP